MDNQAREAIRRSMRVQRRRLEANERARRSLALARYMAASPVFRRCRRIAFYLPNDGELELTPLMTRAREMGKQCFLPVLSPLFHNRLWFAPWEPDDRMLLNRFGIPEPAINWARMCRPWALDLVMTPLVAFDGEGNRLGMGGGFYDRTLAYLAERRVWIKPLLIGVAYEFQRVEALPVAPWDVPLNGIVTEQGLQLY